MNTPNFSISAIRLILCLFASGGVACSGLIGGQDASTEGELSEHVEHDTSSRRSRETAQYTLYPSSDTGEAQEVPYSMAYRSVAAVVRSPKLTKVNEQLSFYTGELLGNVQPLCPQEPYRDQPVIADCSAFLVADDVMVTAGHCVHSQKDCEDIAFNFDYEFEKGFVPTSFNWSGEFRVNHSNMYRCQKVLYRSDGPYSASKQPLNFKKIRPDQWRSLLGYDLAIIQLDRPVENRAPLRFAKPLKVERTSVTTSGFSSETTVTSFGFPNGVPKKYAQGRLVSQNFPYLIAEISVANGFSGSPLLNNRNELVGMIFVGNEDFVWKSRDGIRAPCLVSKVCSGGQCELPGEVALNGRVIEYLLQQLGLIKGEAFPK